jgi:hypothetical protein
LADCSEAGPSLKSFLFTLKNPHNFPLRKCALKNEVTAQIGRTFQAKSPLDHGLPANKP